MLVLIHSMNEIPTHPCPSLLQYHMMADLTCALETYALVIERNKDVDLKRGLTQIPLVILQSPH